MHWAGGVKNSCFLEQDLKDSLFPLSENKLTALGIRILSNIYDGTCNR